MLYSYLKLYYPSIFVTKCHSFTTCVKNSKKCAVYTSLSNDIFINLAFEDWLYKNIDFSKYDLLFLWRNQPTVVIGRHQNPWCECNVQALLQKNIPLARRNSGGGTVFHDLGNLNCTFFTERKYYNRRNNLELVAHVLKENWGLNVSISPREDLVLDNTFKISGTAAKLGGKSAYHHCTVLINVQTSLLHDLLSANTVGFKCKATPSVRADIINIKSRESSITYENLVKYLIEKYIQTYQFCEFILEIFPHDTTFSGLDTLCRDLKTWDWIFGRTPPFNIHRQFQSQQESKALYHIDVSIEKGYFKNVSVTDNTGMEIGYKKVTDLCEILKMEKFWLNDISLVLKKYLRSTSNPVQELPLTYEIAQWIENIVKVT